MQLWVGGDLVYPSVGLITEDGSVVYMSKPQVKVGDVAYWDGSKVKTTPLSKYNTSLGTAVGVVVVPEGFAPDGKVRICSLYGVDASGNKVSSDKSMMWGTHGVDSLLTNYTKVPITDNEDLISSGSDDTGYLPSDIFTEETLVTSFVDPKTKYHPWHTRSGCIPSPYLGDDPCTEYYKIIEGNNVLSDFNGLSNTQYLVGLGSDYKAANAAWKYKDGSSNLQWYLPAMGELGYIMARLNEMNSVISSLWGLPVYNARNYWSSSEFSAYYAYNLSTIYGEVETSLKTDTYYVRPFAILD